MIPPRPSDRGTDGLDGDDQAPSVHPIGEGAGGQRKEQPWQPLGHDRAGDEEGPAGEGDRQQGKGDHYHAVAEG